MARKWLSRRACAAAAAAAAVTTSSRVGSAAIALSPLDALMSSLRQQDANRLQLEQQADEDERLIMMSSQELELEAQLEELLSRYTYGAPRAIATPEQSSRIDAIITQLEATRGRQQRAGWGQSSMRYDLPYIGAWEVLYATEPSGYIGPPQLKLVSARQWIYGPGSGGAATECVYADSSGPSSGSLLVTRTGNVTKLEQAALQLAFEEASRGYQLSYTVRETRRLQMSDGQWGDLVTTRASSTPAVGALLSTAEQRTVCAPDAGLKQTMLQTSYLSDVLWIVRAASGSATVLKRTEAEAYQPSNGDGPDGFDAKRFGPSGRRMWMFDTGYKEADDGYERAKARARADAEFRK